MASHGKVARAVLISLAFGMASCRHADSASTGAAPAADAAPAPVAPAVAPASDAIYPRPKLEGVVGWLYNNDVTVTLGPSGDAGAVWRFDPKDVSELRITKVSLDDAHQIYAATVEFLVTRAERASRVQGTLRYRKSELEGLLLYEAFAVDSVK